MPRRWGRRAPPVSHSTAWLCRSCRAPLGQVRDRVLYPLVPVESVDGRGVARVPCPGCGRVRVWLPARVFPAESERGGTGRTSEITTLCEQFSGP
jgi:hypothetical protein